MSVTIILRHLLLFGTYPFNMTMILSANKANKNEMTINAGTIKTYHILGIAGNFLFKRNLINSNSPINTNAVITKALIVTKSANDSTTYHLCIKHKHSVIYWQYPKKRKNRMTNLTILSILCELLDVIFPIHDTR